MRKIFAYICAVVVVVVVFAVLFSLVGVGVFLLPLLGGAFTANGKSIHPRKASQHLGPLLHHFFGTGYVVRPCCAFHAFSTSRRVALDRDKAQLHPWRRRVPRNIYGGAISLLCFVGHRCCVRVKHKILAFIL